MWPFTGTTTKPLLPTETPSGKANNESTGRRNLTVKALLAVSVVSLLYTSNMSAIMDRMSKPPPPPPFEPPTFEVGSGEYLEETCTRLDSKFEFESPPDFTKIGIESWTDCRSVQASDGWKVEHCTAPGSTWSNPVARSFSGNPESFLPRAKPRQPGQQYAYSHVPETPLPLTTTSCTSQNCSQEVKTPHPTQCNPSGYFRIQRINTPSTDYTIGSDNENPELRCRNNPDRPVALNETTKRYIEDFAGPDVFHVWLSGPELYVADQQINLGNCTYAVPYVLSRPGRFWLTRIDHTYENFQSLNENFDAQFVPKFIGSNILPSVPNKPEQPGYGSSEEVFKVWNDYKKAASEVYKFNVCEGCPQLLNPSSQTKYEHLPACPLTPLEGAREYGVFTGLQSIEQFEDIDTQNYEWVASRPRCRHYPRLITFQTPERYQENLAQVTPIEKPVYGSPPSLPDMEEFGKLHDETMTCVSHSRPIFLAGDSHVRQLFMDFVYRVQGARSDFAGYEGWGTHYGDVQEVKMRQDFDQWFLSIQKRIPYMLGDTSVPRTENDEIDLMEQFDTVFLDHGAWAASGYEVAPLWTSDHFAAFMRDIFWGLAKIREKRREHYKKTGEGFSDFRIIWMGQVPWPDTRPTPDMRTNPRLKYWDFMINEEIDRINEHYKEQGGMIDRLNTFPKIFPFRQLSPDSAHHVDKRPVDAMSQVLAHKLNLCS
ncbi:hypothetical protein BGX26_003403 [Mortierella sp. AD094]|nr:hypothetical protein BGX26_003403 [Mortierella sp. AD094]